MPLAYNVKKVNKVRTLKKLFAAATILSLALLPVRSFAQSLQMPKIKTVVIDAGHGGGDTGAMSKDKKYKEKNITLAVALKFGAMINVAYPSINVIFTRNTDVFIPLDERPAIANRNKADLFISIHVNSEPGTAGSGTETYVMGTHKSGNFELVKRENSVITMENDYTTKYSGFNPNSPESYIIFSLLQNSHLEQSVKLAQCIQEEYKNGPVLIGRGVKPGALYVLWKAAMPAILTEIGFISNNNDLEIITSEAGQRQIAADLLRAFSKYKHLYEGGKLENLPPDAFASVEDNYGNPSTEQNINTEEAKTVKDSPSKSDTLLYPSDTESIAVSNEKKENKTEKTEPAKNSQDQTPREENNKVSESFYCIQILSVNKELKSGSPDLKGSKDAEYVKVGNAYKYYIGNWPTRAEAARHLKELQKKFRGAFVIKISDGEILK